MEGRQLIRSEIATSVISKTLITFLLCIFLISFCYSEDFGYNINDGSINLVNPMNYTSITVNDTLHLEGRDTDALYLYLKGLFNDIYCELTGCEMTGDLFVNTTGNTTIWAQSELNNDVCLYLMESSTLGFSICNDGSGHNELIIGAHNGAGEVSEGLVFDRDSGDIELNGTVTINYDLNVEKNITGNQIYGGMFYHNHTGTELTFTNADTWYPLYFTDATDLNGFSYVGGFGLSSNLTAQVDGKYQASYMAIGSGQNNHVYLTTILIDGVEKPECGNHQKMAAGGDVITQSGVCIITINAGDTVQVVTQDMGGTGDGEYYGGNINLVRIGD